MKTAVIYARYSSDRQTEQSIEGQVRVCNDYAERNGILIVNQYIDRATTGTNDNREEFQKMLKDSDKKQFDFVLVYKLDRFSRNKFEMAMHRKRLKDNGIKILSAMENIPDSPEGILLESLLEGMNQYYSEELSQKTRRGQRETRIKGLHCAGKLNYGYYTEKKKVFIHEEEGPRTTLHIRIHLIRLCRRQSPYALRLFHALQVLPLSRLRSLRGFHRCFCLKYPTKEAV